MTPAQPTARPNIIGAIAVNTAKTPRIIIHGRKGVGKSYYAAKFPRPLVLDLESGYGPIPVPVIGPRAGSDTWDAAWIRSILTDIASHPDDYRQYRTIVVDTIDAVERCIITELCTKERVDTLAGYGYGRGWGLLTAAHDELRDTLDKIARAGYIVVVIAHAEVDKIDDPDVPTETKLMTLQLTRAKDADSWAGWADVIVYIRSTGRDRMYITTPGPGYLAKTRYPMPSGASKDPYTLLAACGVTDLPERPEDAQSPASAPQTAAKAAAGSTPLAKIECTRCHKPITGDPVMVDGNPYCKSCGNMVKLLNGGN